MRSSRFVVGALCALGLAVRADVEPGFDYPLANPGFESGSMTGWSQWSQSSSAYWTVPSPGPGVPAPFAGSHLAGLDNRGLGDVSLWSSFQSPSVVYTPDASHWGEKVAFGAWVYVAETTSAGDIHVQVGCATSGGSSLGTILDSAYDAAALPVAQWVYLPAVPTGTAASGRVLSGTELLTVAVRVEAEGVFFLDGARAGRFDDAVFDLQDPSFESGTLASPGWSKRGTASIATTPTFFANDAYYGNRYVLLQSGNPNPAVYQTLPIDDQTSSPRHGLPVQACAWVKFPTQDAMTGGKVRLAITAIAATAPTSTEISYVEIAPDDKTGRWNYLATPAGVEIPFANANGARITGLSVSLASTVPGTVHADFLQVGEPGAITGHPEKYAIADLFLGFRSELPAEDGYEGDAAYYAAHPTDPINKKRGMWRAWYSAFYSDHTHMDCTDLPPTWNPCSLGTPDHFYEHDPSLLYDASGMPFCDRRGNGRRDVATSIDNPKSVQGGAVSSDGLDDLPLAGAYYALDEDLARWQIAMADAAGFDAFGCEGQGWSWVEHAFPNHPCYGVPTSSPSDPCYPGTGANPDPTNNWANLDLRYPPLPESFLGLDQRLKIAEDTDFKIMPMMYLNPHVGANGGALGHTSMQDAVDAITNDLIAYGRFYYDYKSSLKVRGEMVVGIFFQDQQIICSSGTCPIPWDTILADANTALAMEDPRWKIQLWATQIPSTVNHVTGNYQPAFTGMLAWHMIKPETGLHKYASWSDFVNGGTPLTTPAHPTLSTWEAVAEAHTEDLPFIVSQWAAKEPERLAIGLFCPDFDNSGRALSNPAQISPTGHPSEAICVRITSEYLLDPSLGQVSTGWLERQFEKHEEAGMDWLFLATWNDWPESTHVEPMWRSEYWEKTQEPTFNPLTHPSLLSIPSGQYEEIFGRLLEVQQGLAAFKGQSLDPALFHQLTGAYLHAQSTGAARAFE